MLRFLLLALLLVPSGVLNAQPRNLEIYWLDVVGGAATLIVSPSGIEGIWQGHLSLLDKDPKHNTSESMIANFEETADCKH
jgi:hypothetical protein